MVADQRDSQVKIYNRDDEPLKVIQIIEIFLKMLIH